MWSIGSPSFAVVFLPNPMPHPIIDQLAQASRYAQKVWYYRHFWIHLALSDLRARFRRSHVGLLWVALQPMLLTIIMSIVLKFVFRQSFEDYSIYVFSGMIVWDVIVSSIMIGASSLVSAEGYVRQVHLPIAIYPMKAILYCSIVFAMAFVGFSLYAMVVKPEIFSWRWIYSVPFFALLAFFCAPLAIISSIINIKFRDFQQFIGLVLQMLWYISPVLVLRPFFDHPGLREWTAINPVAAIMDLFRMPVIDHTDPNLAQIALVLGYALVLWGFAFLMLKRNERKIVFYY